MLIVVMVYREDPTTKILEVFFLSQPAWQNFAIISCCLDCTDPDPNVDYC